MQIYFAPLSILISISHAQNFHLRKGEGTANTSALGWSISVGRSNSFGKRVRKEGRMMPPWVSVWMDYTFARVWAGLLLCQKERKRLDQNFVNKKEILPNEVIFLICFKFIYHWSSSHVLQTSRADYYRWPNALIIMDFQRSRNVLVGCQKIQKRDNTNRKSDIYEQYSYLLSIIFEVWMQLSSALWVTIYDSES